ncbi:Sodium/potassium-transporting ATPase subunit alpha [Orchesella cincta]|uniref:Sodium/potassium-transporting ATPase subunit alpha n=1 Tax=Orchesella cincta TaxID=48709 RepID=A0A1D2NBE0_ORCCI|nr:Sodium/potassium-transporting ATPase subunit alpha [Orchesella cincta]
MVGKIRPARFDVAGILNKGFEPDPRLKKVEESTNEVPWNTDVHQIPLRRLLDRYGGSITKGLTEFQVLRNRESYGSNAIVSPTIPPSLKCWNVFKSVVFGLNSLIWVCLIFSVAVFLIRWFCLREKIIEHLIFAGALLFAITVTTISFHYQTLRSQRILSSSSPSSSHTLARRNGRFVEIPSSELVVGDVIQLSYGDVVPADIRIIESHEFFVDNSGLTGESDPKRRRSVCTNNNPLETKNMAFYSTYALEGFAKAVVVNVGNNTLMGKVAEVATNVECKSESPIRKELNKLVRLLILQAIFFGSFFFAVFMVLDNDWKGALVYVMTVVVANVPEGLALTSTILLALIAKKLQSLSCVVKNLHSIETLGSTTCICTDKTGTITQNRMAIAHLWFDDRVAEADTSEFLDGHVRFKLDDPGFKALARVARLCSRAKFKPHQTDKPIFRREVQGDSTEAAILRFMETHLGSVTKYRRKYKKLYERPFNSRTKLQIFVYNIPQEDGRIQHYLTVKGAPEKLFKLCTSILIKDEAFKLDDKWKAKFNMILEKLASVGDRIIGFADALLPRDKFNENYDYDTDKPEYLNMGMRFVGLMSMIDPPRAAIPQAVLNCKKAGVKVVMITGDHPITATAIARATGIFEPHPSTAPPTTANDVIKKVASEKDLRKPEKVYCGQDLLGLEPYQLDAILSQNGDFIFARTTPEQKYLIVESLQRLGHRVTVVGDGVNDSPAIKRADVGIVMGVTGSEVSKAIGDMVLLDDNFATVVQGIEEGRLGFENLSKLLRYTMADNIAQLYCSGISIILEIPKPFASMAMLLTVLGTDILPAISICYEQMETDVLRGTWHPKSISMITSQLMAHIYTQTAVIELAAGFFSYFATMACYGFSPLKVITIRILWNCKSVNDLQDDIFGQEWTYDARKRLEAYCQSVFFVAIVVMQVANVLICKGHTASLRKTIFMNWKMNMAICAELAIAGLLLYVPKISFVTGLMPISISEWLYAVPFACLLIVCDEIRRYFLRKKKLDPALSHFILN